MKYIAFVLIFMSSSLWAAGLPLNKGLIESFYTVAEKISSLESKYPKVFAESEKLSSVGDEKTIKFMEASKAYPDIKNILSSSEFSDLDAFFDVSSRLMGSLYSAQIKKMPAGMDINSMFQLQEKSIANMEKTSGVPASVISEMKESLSKAKAQRKHMEIASRKASEADKKFILDNMAWVMTMIPDLGGHDEE
ncbi:MAG: hypothetical protein KUG83_04490 [Gammaproteobacteria bacterium]|nr:hypothetical protein [Gammaproteobacteria bacterium]